MGKGKVTDPNILNAEEITSRIELNDSVWVGEILRSHAAQAKLIEELETAQSGLKTLVRFAEQKRDAAIQRAEQAEEYRTTVAGVIASMIKQNPSLNHEWGGLRIGWGFAFEWIRWVSERAITSEALLASIKEALPVHICRMIANDLEKAGLPGYVTLCKFADALGGVNPPTPNQLDDAAYMELAGKDPQQEGKL